MIQKLTKILSLIVLFSNVGFSQNEANIWYFGSNAGLDFNSGSPVPLLDGALDTEEGFLQLSPLYQTLSNATKALHSDDFASTFRRLNGEVLADKTVEAQV